MQPIVTRFAPSPTGLLHVGGARTALLAWAYARKHAGRFLLRLEDTDLARSSEASAEAILDDLRWLGLEADNQSEIPRQSQRNDLYREHLDKLRASHPDQVYEDDGAIRFRVVEDITFDDAVFGRVEVKATDIEDFVIIKGPSSSGGGGGPTFHFAVVVDDALMGVTHVIRGQEHLSNTPRHAALCDALGFDRPTWAHLPSILNADGSKMSKRDKAKAARKAAQQHQVAATGLGRGSAAISESQLQQFLAGENDDLTVATALLIEMGLTPPEIDVADFRQSGYLPSVLINYLALLGWSPPPEAGKDIERFGPDPWGFLTEHFALERVGKSNAKFDRDKLLKFNAEGIASLDADIFREILRQHFERYHPEFASLTEDTEKWPVFVEAVQERSRTLEEPADTGRFLIVEDDAIAYNLDDKGVQKNLLKNEGEGMKVLRELRGVLAEVSPWSGEAGHEAVVAFAKERGLGLGKVAQPIRVAVTGTTISPPIDHTLELFGRERTLNRIDRCLNALDDRN